MEVVYHGLSAQTRGSLADTSCVPILNRHVFQALSLKTHISVASSSLCMNTACTFSPCNVLFLLQCFQSSPGRSHIALEDPRKQKKSQHEDTELLLSNVTAAGFETKVIYHIREDPTFQQHLYNPSPRACIPLCKVSCSLLLKVIWKPRLRT